MEEIIADKKEQEKTESLTMEKIGVEQIIQDNINVFNKVMEMLKDRSNEIDKRLETINEYLEYLNNYNKKEETEYGKMKVEYLGEELDKFQERRRFNETIWGIKADKYLTEKINLENTKKRYTLYINRGIRYLQCFGKLVKADNKENISSKEKYDILKDGVDLTSMIQRELLSHLEIKESELNNKLVQDGSYIELKESLNYDMKIDLPILKEEERQKVVLELEQLLDNKQTYMEAFRDNPKIDWKIKMLTDDQFLNYDIEALVIKVYGLEKNKDVTKTA